MTASPAMPARVEALPIIVRSLAAPGPARHRPEVEPSRPWASARLLLPAALLAIAATALLSSRLGLDALGRHMATHILLMNAAMPLLALALARSGRGSRARPGELACATAAQVAVLWVAHLPAAMERSHAAVPTSLLVTLALAAAALWFWRAVIAQAGAGRWRALLALLLSGKLFCLIGAVLTFAPRHLYPFLAVAHGSDLDDQRLAGLLMLAACPASYVLAGIVIAVRWIDELAADDG